MMEIENEYFKDLVPTPTDNLMQRFLPMEVWSKILENMASDSNSVLLFRKINLAFKHELDRLMAAKPAELDPLTVDDIPMKSIRPTKMLDLYAVTGFINEMRTSTDNPFPTRSLMISPFNPKLCRCINYCFCRRNRVFENELLLVSDFCERFGYDVCRLTFIMKNRDAIRHVYVFQDFPNLCHLEIKMLGGNNLEFGSGNFNWLTDFDFPELVRLTSLKLQFKDVDCSEILTTKLVRTYGTQIKSLTVSIYSYVNINCDQSTNSFAELSSEDIPNLTNLKVRFMPEPEQNVLNFLKRGTWPLKQLTLYGMKSLKLTNYQLSDVVGLLSRYASTLQIFHLHFPDYSRFILRLQGLSKPNKMTPAEVANELQLKVTLPLVRECSLPYSCVSKKLSAAARLCEKFENLKTLHLYDDRAEDAGFDVQKQNYEEELSEKWWPFVSPASKLERVIVFSGNEFDENVVVLKVIEKPSI